MFFVDKTFLNNFLQLYQQPDEDLFKSNIFFKSLKSSSSLKLWIFEKTKFSSWNTKFYYFLIFFTWQKILTFVIITFNV